MRVCWLALALFFACDGIGDPVVGTTRRAPAGDFTCMQPPIDCATPFVAQPFGSPQPVRVEQFCSVEFSSAPCVDARQGNGCALTLRVVEAVPVVLPMQSCVTLDLTPAAGSDHAELRALVATHSRIVLHAEQPTTFVFSELELSDSAIELSGPITLSLEGALKNVSITSRDDVQVTITGTPSTQLAMSLPNGSLRIQRSTLTLSRLNARDVNLETVPFNDLDVTAERLIGIELDGSRVRLDVGDLSLSEVEATALEVSRCDSALLVNTRLNTPVLAACSELLRAHSSAFVAGRAHGPIESINTYWGSMHFGAGGADTRVALWSGTITTSILCSNLARLTISQSSSVTCNDCTPVAAPEQRFCMVAGEEGYDPDAGVFMGGNDKCPLLDQLPRCDPVPVPTSPL